MRGRFLTVPLALLIAFTFSIWASADTVRLANGDMLRGDVVSLDDKQMKLKSETFGELTIPRDKVEVIYLGNAQPPVAEPSVHAAPPASLPQQPGAALPSLQSPQMQQQLAPMLNRLLGGADLQNLQDDAAQARQGLKDLKKDMRGPEAQALDAYINILDLIAAPPQPQAGTPPQPEPQDRPAQETPPSDQDANETAPPE